MAYDPPKYKEYVALLSQTGTDAPTAVILGSNTVGSIVWTRGAAGEYVGTLTGAFVENKTFLLPGTFSETGSVILTSLVRTSANTIAMQTKNSSLTNIDVWTNIPVLIRIYN